MKTMMKPLASAVLLAGISSTVLADDQQTIQALEQRIQELENTLNERLDVLADAVEKQQTSGQDNKVHIGGYGEMHYNNLDENGEDTRTLDFHRMVLFFGYDFSDRARFVTEFEVEHILVSASSGGAVEIEQAYLEFDLKDNMQLRTGMLLMPVGLVNETHEPPTFYGVERPVVETTIIPTTWYSNGISFTHRLSNGISYDLMISEGLKTEDPTTSSDADPFDLKAGKQKGSNADAFDLATTARIRYTGVAGLELAAYAQYQPDLDQSAVDSYAESATLVGAHAVYQWNSITTKALYARWDLAGDDAKAAGKNVQDGGYVEINWRPSEQWGVFARQSNWSQETGVDAAQSDVGVNYWPLPDIVFKADVQMQNDDAGNADGFNLGMGYQF
ncbi:porin [Thalassolituus sp. LLYu03]|uniref:porin n=1 Tax=Thalassolituus sp. LLYu03 TaxID=3421656 RepID=UPI003D274E2C